MGPTPGTGANILRTMVFGRGRFADSAAAPATLCLRSADAANETFCVDIADAAGRQVARLGPFSDEEAVAIWRSLGASSGLTLVLADQDGAVHVAAQIGRLQLGRLRARRRMAPAGRRRPRFLARRKSASLPRRPLVYREPELAARPDGR